MLGVYIAIGVVVFLLIAIIAVYITKYRTVGPDEALIVTGSYLGKKMYIPMIQEIVLKLFVVAVHLYFRYSNKQNHLVYYRVN